MSKLKDIVIGGIIEREGGYSNNPNDAGGETMYGITKDVARKNGWRGEMKDLPLAVAYKIYSDKYWDALNLDGIEKLSLPIAVEIADTGVNMGVATAAKFLQRSLNVFNSQGKDYPDIKVDGQIGGATISALNKFLLKRGAKGEQTLLKALNALQGAGYISIAEYNPKNETFTFGWFVNRIS